MTRDETLTAEEVEGKDKLKKEAEGYVKKILEGTEFEDDDIDVCAYTKREMLEAILHFAKPREKQIQIDAEQIRALQKQNGELTDKVKELKAQIEKMKCCQNCSHLCSRCELGIDGCYVCSKWEIKEND